MRKLTFPLNKGCGIVPFSLPKGPVESLRMSVCLVIYLFLIDFCVFHLKASHISPICRRALQNVHRHTAPAVFAQLWLYFSTPVAMARESPHPNNLQPPPGSSITPRWQGSPPEA